MGFRNLFLVLGILPSLYLSSASALPQEVQHCFLSRSYDAGYINPTTMDMIVKNMFGGNLNEFIAYSAVNISAIPAQYLQPGGQLETLLKSKMIAVARAFPSVTNAYDIMVIQKDSFKFVRENNNLNGLILMMYVAGDNYKILEELLTIIPSEILVAKVVGPVEFEDVSCNF